MPHNCNEEVQILSGFFHKSMLRSHLREFARHAGDKSLLK